MQDFTQRDFVQHGSLVGDQVICSLSGSVNAYPRGTTALTSRHLLRQEGYDCCASVLSMTMSSSGRELLGSSMEVHEFFMNSYDVFKKSFPIFQRFLGLSWDGSQIPYVCLRFPVGTERSI